MLKESTLINRSNFVHKETNWGQVLSVLKAPVQSWGQFIVAICEDRGQVLSVLNTFTFRTCPMGLRFWLSHPLDILRFWHHLCPVFLSLTYTYPMTVIGVVEPDSVLPLMLGSTWQNKKSLSLVLPFTSVSCLVKGFFHMLLIDCALSMFVNICILTLSFLRLSENMLRHTQMACSTMPFCSQHSGNRQALDIFLPALHVPGSTWRTSAFGLETSEWI